jgi:hypothetical protein
MVQKSSAEVVTNSQGETNLLLRPAAITEWQGGGHIRAEHPQWRSLDLASSSLLFAIFSANR